MRLKYRHYFLLVLGIYISVLLELAHFYSHISNEENWLPGETEAARHRKALNFSCSHINQYSPLVTSRIQGTEQTVIESTMKHMTDKIPKSNLFIYNRIPKCASSTVFFALMDLAKLQSNYSMLYGNGGYSVSAVKEEEDIQLLQAIATVKNKPIIFTKHIYYMDFERLCYNDPVFINVVRNPVDRMISRHFVGDHHKTEFDECRNQIKCWASIKEAAVNTGALPFLCGNDAFCTTNSTQSLARAKLNVEKHYSLVGVTERLDDFFKAMEILWPMFKGLTVLVKPANVRTDKRFVSNATRAAMADLVKEEMELYHFIMKTFHEKFKVLSEWRKSHVTGSHVSSNHSLPLPKGNDRKGNNVESAFLQHMLKQLDYNAEKTYM